MPELESLVKEYDGDATEPLLAKKFPTADLEDKIDKELPSLNKMTAVPSETGIGVCKLPDTWNDIEYPA